MKEIEQLKKSSNEEALIEIIEEIGDKISFRGYSREQVISLVEELINIDLLSVEYATREEALNVLCEAVSCYGIRSEIKWDSIIEISDKVEDDLKEYIEEITMLI